ncbi:substrate-binding domain-containing protein [Shewanella waksmanii]|uniref:substrate-binding domain-containing protein n=1 Tax=Shewanella waksmanii TaxID=213783 RepID=UPI003736F394
MRFIWIFLIACCVTSFSLYGKTWRFALVPKETNNPFFIATAEGCRVAAAELGNVECLFRGHQHVDVRMQDKIISELLDEGVDGIAIAVTQSEFLASRSVAKANRLGVPLITYDADFSAATLANNPQIRAAYVGSDNLAIGQALGEQLQRLRPNGGQLIIQSGRPDSPNLNLRVMGIRMALSGKQYSTPPGQALVGENGWREFRAPMYNFGHNTNALIDLKTVLKLFDEQLVDAFVAVGGWAQLADAFSLTVAPYRSALKANDMVLVIGDTSPQQMLFLDDGVTHANVGQNPFEMGKQTINTLYRIANNLPYQRRLEIPLNFCDQLNFHTCLGN